MEKETRKVVLYIAMSLDGYIADQNGGVAWLAGDGSDAEHPGSYLDFIETVDTVIMGYHTYRQIAEELSPGAWPYAGKKCFVVTHRECGSTDEICFTDRSPTELVRDLRQEEGTDIWVCGGANVANQLMESDEIDRFHITVIPVILGSGIPLFSGQREGRELKLILSQSYNGMTDLIYERRYGTER